MDQIKIGKFIAEQRKNKNLTQADLAEKLNVTNRAVSKWETGRSMPDASIMPELCLILGITVNDLFCGEIIIMENYNKELEKNLLEITKQKEDADKKLLFLEVVMGVISIAVLLTLTIVASYVQMDDWVRILLILIGFVPVLVAAPFMLKIEQIAGYYHCKKCGNKYVPSYKSVNLSMHIGRTRYMKCPKCNQRSWHKKVVTKSENKDH